jgi:3-hydroxyisobutyrate dehydrogenase
MADRLGFIGLGLMGQPMALRLLGAGHSLTVWNRTPAKLAAALDAGATAAATAADVARACDIVFMCLTDATAVERVVLAEGGIGAGAAPGKIVVDFSSIAPDATREMAGRLQSRCGMTWVDAPVSGGVPGAEAGTLAVMAGGTEDDIERVRPYVARMSRRLTHMGETGAGQIAKLCNQMIVSATLTVVAEAIALAERAGIDAALLPEALEGGFADSTPFQLFAPRMVSGEFEPPLGAIWTLLKDAENARSLARAISAETPMTDLVVETFNRVIAAGDPEDDVATLINRYR